MWTKLECHWKLQIEIRDSATDNWDGVCRRHDKNKYDVIKCHYLYSLEPANIWVTWNNDNKRLYFNRFSSFDRERVQDH